MLPPPGMAEIIEGRLIESPRRPLPTNLALQAVLSELWVFNRPTAGGNSTSGWRIVLEPELHLGFDVVVPDVAGWRRDRPPARATRAAAQVPDWICEVVSPLTADIDRGVKMSIYARAGVSSLWIVDPMLRSLEVYRHANGGWVTARCFVGDHSARAEPFQAVSLSVARWWAA